MKTRTLGDVIDEFVRQVKAGKNPRVFVTSHLLRELADLLKREGFALSQKCLSKISNRAHREALETLLCSTCAFAAAGATIGGSVAGPEGAIAGAAIGAAVGLGVGALVVMFVSFEPDPARGGYVLGLAAA